MCAIHKCTRFAKVNRVCLAHARHLQPLTPASSISSPLNAASYILQGLVLTRAKVNRNRKCQAPQCLSFARSGGFCTRHGGGRKCKVDGCRTSAQTGGFCRLHGGGSKCRVPRCDQFARIRGRCLDHHEIQC
ncbi:Aste57867_10491 [Aphanomyces stellatus]|uniref:Aste57867_10491 protein n=1 Tax=Aphanomyces stellatus TaxID=120398 RepID=A0A485KQH7_9STRA|nr:hypothetical protein As57867_010451 [Aphanomyces stellatus]VFT87365.1 Aste57867_10491 [Aphanomyces stellatus]